MKDLQSLILQRRAKNNPESFFDGLLDRYGSDPKEKVKKRKTKKKKGRKGKKKKDMKKNLYDVDDAEFDRI